MNSSNPIVTNNVRVWRQSKGLIARENEVKRILEEREAHEIKLAEETASREARLAKAQRCGATIPLGAVDVKFRRGKDGRGGRLFWKWIFAPAC